MVKFQNPFRKQPVVDPTKPQPEVETAIVIIQYENGGPSVGFLNVGGIKVKRVATMNDMFRMVCEVQQQINTISICDRVMNILQPKQPINIPVNVPGLKREEAEIRGYGPEEKKVEDKVEKPDNVVDNQEAPKEPEHPA